MPSLLQQLSELTSQQVHNIHASHDRGWSAPTASGDSELIWQQADDAASSKHNVAADAQPASTSLLSPAVLRSASYTHSQLCHDLPLLTSDGVDALSRGLQSHIAASVLPASFFQLTLPFLAQLTSPTAAASTNEALVGSLSQLGGVVLFSLFPLLLTSSQHDLSAFLCSLPASLPALLAAEQEREAAERAAVPAFVIDNTDVAEEKEQKVMEWSAREGANTEEDCDDDDEFTADPDEQEEEEEWVDERPAVVAREAEVSSWAEIEDKLCSLILLWHPRSLMAPLPPSSPAASPQPVWERLQIPSVLVHVHSLASRHSHLFQPSLPAATLLHHRLSTTLLSLLLSSPPLIPSYLPTVLSLLPTCSLSLDAFEPARPFVETAQEDERVCLLLLSHLCGSDKVRAAADGRSSVWRLLDRNLPWLASYLQHIRTSLTAAASTPSASSPSIAVQLSLLSSLVVVCDFYVCCHPGLKAGRVDVGESLLSAGIIEQLLSLLPLALTPTPAASAADHFPLPSLYTFLTTASALSPLVAQQCERATSLLQQLSSVDHGQSAWQADKLLLPVLLAWHLLHSERRSSVADSQSAAKQTADKAPKNKAGRKKAKLLVSAIAEEEDKATDDLLLPAVDAASAPPPAAVTALAPLLARTIVAMRQHTGELVAGAEAGGFSPLVDALSLLARLVQLSPKLSAVVRPTSPAPSDGQLDKQLCEWAAAVGEVKRAAGEAVRRVGGGASSNQNAAVEVAEDDEQRRQRVRGEQRARHLKLQHTAEVQRLMLCCKALFVDTASGKRD